MTMEKKILALSGGGYRGLYTISILRRLEERIGEPLCEHFNLITGTSIGGIIALSIAAGIPLKTIEDTFIKHGSLIFPKPVEEKINCKLLRFLQPIRVIYRKVRAIFSAIHPQDGLRTVLIDLFGDKVMGDLTNAYVVVTTANLSTGKPKMFKTPHHEDIYLDERLKVVDVALVTSAAPVYFPMHEIEELQTQFADGGLVGNAPGLFGWLEAKTRLNTKDKDICVLSVGTLAGTPSLSGSTTPNKGAAFWLSPGKLRLLSFLMAQQGLVG